MSWFGKRHERMLSPQSVINPRLAMQRQQWRETSLRTNPEHPHINILETPNGLYRLVSRLFRLEIDHTSLATSLQNNLQQNLHSSTVIARAAYDLADSTLETLDTRTRSNLRYGGLGSFIFDAHGIRSLANAKGMFFADSIVRGVIVALGYLKKGKKYLRLGPAGGRNPTGELIEAGVMRDDGSGRSMTVNASFLEKSDVSTIGLAARVDGRALLSQLGYLEQADSPQKTNNILVEIIVGNEQGELPQLVHEALIKSGIQAYVLRMTVEASTNSPTPLTIKGTVIKELPVNPLSEKKQVGELLISQEFQLNSGQSIRLLGTYQPRPDTRWEQLTGQHEYAPFGHIHGVTDSPTDTQPQGFHFVSATLPIGTKITAIITPIEITASLEPIAVVNHTVANRMGLISMQS